MWLDGDWRVHGAEGCHVDVNDDDGDAVEAAGFDLGKPLSLLPLLRTYWY